MPENPLFVLGQFPTYSETFIYRELILLVKHFSNARIVVLKKNRYVLPNPDFACLEQYIVFKQDGFLRHLPRVIFLIIVNPLKTLKYLLMIFSLYFPQKDLLVYIRDFFYFLHIGLYCRENGITHIHACQANYPAACALTIMMFFGFSFTFSAHANDLYTDLASLKYKISKTGGVICCSKNNLHYLSQTYPEQAHKIICIYHGLAAAEENPYLNRRKNTEDLKESTKKNQAALSLLAVGRMVPKKGFTALIDLAQLLCSQKTAFHLDIIGGGPEEKILKQLIREKNLEDYITLHGQYSYSRVKDFYAGADFLLVPSLAMKNLDSDQIPNVILEAFRYGVIVIANNTGAIHEAVINRKTGFLVKSNFIREASSIINNRKNSTMYQAIRHHASALIAEKFNIHKNINHFIQVLEKK
ncbi:MAG: hypothetical protein A2096_06980 [Spirochaetes bacterium GWF1_41_5]|nr:MAG: hypothetical protein A2096_06980 [Spirochaetes bacterium GWF1_41_5]